MLESARALEKESLIARASMGNELTALRSLVLDGRWDSVESVLRPMHGHPGLDTSGALLAVRRQRFLELFEGSVRRACCARSAGALAARWRSLARVRADVAVRW